MFKKNFNHFKFKTQENQNFIHEIKKSALELYHEPKKMEKEVSILKISDTFDENFSERKNRLKGQILSLKKLKKMSILNVLKCNNDFSNKPKISNNKTQIKVKELRSEVIKKFLNRCTKNFTRINLRAKS